MPVMDKPEPAGGASARVLPLPDSVLPEPATPPPAAVLPPLASVTAPVIDLQAPLLFKVRYSLVEYVVFMWQHTGYLIRRRRIGRFNMFWMTWTNTWSAALHFTLQGRSRHVYEFTVDQHGIVRTTGSGVTLVPWTDVSAIRRYARGYMIVLKRGTLPIPYRCLDVQQAAAMEVYAVRLREAARLQSRLH